MEENNLTYSKLPGVYFTETVTDNAEFTEDEVPLFLVQTSTAIATIDNKITSYTNFKAFETIAKNKGLTKTLKYMQDVLTESENDNFYVYSIKTDTADAFTGAITSTAHLTDVTNIIYVEEAKSSNNNSITTKIGAIKSGVHSNAENGVFREAYVIPYGTVKDAVDNAENTAPEAVIVTTLTTITTGDGDGRICVTLPDSLAGCVVGHCIGSDYDEEPGFRPLGLLDLTGLYNFDATQMLTLQNMGVLFVRPERLQGVNQYRINLGVTTSFKESSADGLIVCRTTVDAMLRRIAFEGQAFVKAKENESNRAAFNSVISGIISDFASEESINRNGTKLSVADAGNSTFTVTGTIQPIKSVIAIEVNTTITA
jgi:hypothetical protein